MSELGLDINGTILGKTRLSKVDGQTGRINYCGYDLHELATHASCEEVIYLLWYDTLPTIAQLDEFREHLATARCLDGDEMEFMRALPRDGHGMDALRTAVSALTEIHPTDVMHADTVLEQGLKMTAKLPTIVTTLIHLRSNEEPIPPRPDLGHAANFLWMLNGTLPDDIERQTMDSYMVLLAENGLNISTFVASVVASTQNDLHAALTAAIAALKGLAHGGANEQAMRTFMAIGGTEHVEEYLDGMLSRKERLMGVGHRVFAVEDPRVQHMRRLSASLASRPKSNDQTHAIAERVSDVLREHPYYNQRKLYPNVEFFSAPLLYQLNFPIDFFTAAFACARIPGWIAHIKEQLTTHRLVRPEAAYVGEQSRQFVPLGQRVHVQNWD